MDLSKIGKTIKDKRQEMNLSLREVSALSQVAGSTISQIETGKTSPNLLTLKAICDTLDIPVFSLFLEEDSQVQLVRFRDQKSFVRNTSNGKALTESLIIHGRTKCTQPLSQFPPAQTPANSHAMAEKNLYMCCREMLRLNWKTTAAMSWRSMIPCITLIISDTDG